MANLAGDPLSEEMWGFGGTVLAQQGTVGVAQVELTRSLWWKVLLYFVHLTVKWIQVCGFIFSRLVFVDFAL